MYSLKMGQNFYLSEGNMKKIIIFCVLVAMVTPVFAQDSKVSDLVDKTAPVDSDALYLVEDIGGTPASKRVSLGNLYTNLFADKLPFEDVVSVHGAVGDGVADDTAEIHAARDAAGVGGTVVLPAGYTYLTCGLTASVADQIWVIDGTVQQSNSCNARALDVTAAGVTVKGSGIIDANEPNNTPSAHGIRITANEVTVEGLEIKNTDVGVRFTNVSSGKIQHTWMDTGISNSCIFAEAASTDETGIRILYNHCDRTDEGATYTEGGLKARGDNSTLTMDTILIQGNTVNLVVPTSDSGNVAIETWGLSEDVSIVGNVTNGGHIGISLDATDNATVSGNTTRNVGSVGLEIVECDGVAVTGHSHTDTSQTNSGINIDTSTRVSVTGFSVIGPTDGIRVVDVTSDVVIADGVIYNVGEDGIDFANGGVDLDLDHFRLSGVIIRGAQYGIRFSGTGAINYADYSDITIIDATVKGVQMKNSTDTSWSNIRIIDNNSDTGHGFHSQGTNDELELDRIIVHGYDGAGATGIEIGSGTTNCEYERLKADDATTALTLNTCASV